jgi:hypothetical protein
MVSLIVKSFWLIEAGPHRGRVHFITTRQFEERMIVLSDTGFHAAEGDPSNLKLCPRGEWEDRMLVETVLSMLTLVCHFKKVMHRVWTYFHARLAFTMAAFNVLVQWYGFQPTASGFVPLSMAEFSL